MNRRSFLGSILALSAAPAIVRAESLMPIMSWNYGPLPIGELVIARFAIPGIRYWDQCGAFYPNGIDVSGIATLDIREGRTVIIKASGFVHRDDKGLFVGAPKYISRWKRP